MKSFVVLALLAVAVSCFDDHDLQLDFGPEGVKGYLLHRFPDGDIDFCNEQNQASNDDLLNFIQNLLVGNASTVANLTVDSDGKGQRTINVNDLLHKKKIQVDQEASGSTHAILAARKGPGHFGAGIRLNASGKGQTTVAGKAYSVSGTYGARGGILIRHRCREEDNEEELDAEEEELAFDKEDEDRHHHKHHHRHHRKGVRVVAGLGVVKKLSGENFSRKEYVRAGARALITKGRRGGVEVYISGGSRRFIEQTVGNKTRKVAIRSRSFGKVDVRACSKHEDFEGYFDTENIVL